MMMTWILLFVWLACGIVNYGLMFAYFQRKFPSIADEQYWSDVTFATTAVVTGPICLLASLVVCEPFRYGFKWR
jgi:hypothetical protein